MSKIRFAILRIGAFLTASLLGGAGAQAQTPAELNAWHWARHMNTPEAYQWFLENYPDSAYRGNAFRRLGDSIDLAPAAGPDEGVAASPGAGVPDAPSPSVGGGASAQSGFGLY